MPELPEVEVVRQFLESKIIGNKIKKITVLNVKSFFGDENRILNQEIISVKRKGKQLSIIFRNKCILLFHLKMTGQVIFLDESRTVLGHPTPKENYNNLPNKSTRIIFDFNNKSKIFFNDQRKFGWAKIFNQDELRSFQSNLGIDMLSEQMNQDYFFDQLKSSSRSVKLVLLDQSKFAGIGNIYANDALFLSKIHPLSKSNNISKFDSNNLLSNLINIMKQSILSGGSTAKDNGYVKPDGDYGKHQFDFQVYQRFEEPCHVCNTKIDKVKQGGRYSFFCPNCQKNNAI